MFLAINVRDPVARIVSLYGHLKLFRKEDLGSLQSFARAEGNTVTK